MNSKRTIGFEWKESLDIASKTYLLSMEGVIAVSQSSPFGLHPELADGFCGMSLWEGLVTPVLDLTPILGPRYLKVFEGIKNVNSQISLYFKTPKIHLGRIQFPIITVLLPGPVYSRTDDVKKESMKYFSLEELLFCCLRSSLDSQGSYGKSA